LRIKEQGTHLTLHEHDDADDEVRFLWETIFLNLLILSTPLKEKRYNTFHALRISIIIKVFG
jgi:hypothetical protein